MAINAVNPGTGTVNPGNITIESTGGAIDTTAGYLQSSADGNSGNIQLKAAGDIRTGMIDSSGLWAGTGGSISLESTGGIIDTSLGMLNSFSTFGVAGEVTLKAAGDITTGNIMSNSGQQGGNITITSITGLINAENGDLSSNSSSGNGGNVTLEAAGNIATKNIIAFGAITGGNVTVNSGGSFSSSEQILSYASDLISSGVGGNVDIHAASDITLGTNTIFSAISSIGEQQGGSITITSDTGKITANADIFLSSDSGTAGNVTLDAPGNIDLANILSFGEMKGGSVSITSDTSIDVDAINSYSETGQGGDVSIIAEGNITLSGDFYGNTIRSEGPQQGGSISITSNTGEINATAGNLDSYSINGIAGNVTLESAGNIATSNIRSQGAFLGGNIDITTGGGFTTTGTINSYASNATTGEAGDVNITANSDITLGGDANNSAIRSEGATVGGNISISSTSGAINANAGNLDSYSAKGTAGSVNLDAATGIDIANIRSDGDTKGGSISITSDTNLDFTGSTLNSYSQNGEAGDVSITANGNITLGGDASNSAIRSEGSQVGGNISITSTNGKINATAGNLDSYSTNGTAGNVILDATGNIATSNIRSQGASVGGNIDITTGGTFTTTGTINSYASDANTGNAGDVNITANSNITLGGDANNSAIRSEGATVGGNKH
ncbi:MAG: hypothetical protein Fur0025_46860 [Oscillatoriaceae cyanobacterium]